MELEHSKRTKTLIKVEKLRERRFYTNNWEFNFVNAPMAERDSKYNIVHNNCIRSQNTRKTRVTFDKR